MYKIFRYFSIACLVAIVITALSLSAFLYRQAANAVVQMGELHNATITRVYLNSLGPELPVLLHRVSEIIDKKELQSEPAAKKISQALLRVTKNIPTTKVAIYNMAGLAVVSTEPQNIGDDERANSGVVVAKTGQVVSALIHRGQPSPFDGAVPNYDIVETYVPLYNDADGTIDGVAEVHFDVTQLMAQLMASHMQALVAVGIALALLYGVLVLIVRYAATMVRRHEQTILNHARALEESRTFIESLFDAEVGGIIVLDRQGIVVKANKFARALATNEPEGHHFAVVFPHHDPAYITQLVECTFEKALGQHGDCICHTPTPEDKQCKETCRLGRHGNCISHAPSSRILSTDSCPVFDAEGRPHLVILHFNDVTEEKQMEMQLRRQEKLVSLGVLAAGLAHDIGNPLASLASELQLLEGETDFTQIRDSLNVIKHLTERMSATLREMRDFARRSEPINLNVSLREAVDAAVRTLRFDPRAPGIDISVEIAPDLPIVLMAKNYLVLVLVNLLLNAFDAMVEGGRIRVRGYSAPAGGVVLEVQDSGIGMAPETVSRVLEPLYTTKVQGMGLGFTVSQEIVRSFGGTLDLASEPGQGTTVSLRFPAPRCIIESSNKQEVANG